MEVTTSENVRTFLANATEEDLFNVFSVYINLVNKNSSPAEVEVVGKGEAYPEENVTIEVPVYSNKGGESVMDMSEQVQLFTLVDDSLDQLDQPMFRALALRLDYQYYLRFNKLAKEPIEAGEE